MAPAEEHEQDMIVAEGGQGLRDSSVSTRVAALSSEILPLNSRSHYLGALSSHWQVTMFLNIR